MAYRVLSIDSQNLDSDGDGLTDAEETGGMEIRDTSGSFAYGYIYTNASDRDSDGDGLSDGEEMGPRHYDANGYPYYVVISSPNLVDSDNDGLDDGAEVEIGTKPLVADTDGDGLLDGEEVYGWDEDVGGLYVVFDGVPIVPISTVKEHMYFGTDPLKNDTDCDGYNDYYETKGTSYLVVTRQSDNLVTVETCYRIQMYDPLFPESGVHPSGVSLYMDGLSGGYSESYPYKDNPLYVEGCLNNQKGMLAVTIAPLAIPGLELFGLGGVYELEEVTSEEEPEVQAELSAASEGELHDYEIVEAIESGDHDQVISAVRSRVSDATYEGLTSSEVGVSSSTLEAMLLDGVKVDDVYSTLSEQGQLTPEYGQYLNKVYGLDPYSPFREKATADLKNIVLNSNDQEALDNLFNIATPEERMNSIDYGEKLQNVQGSDRTIKNLIGANKPNTFKGPYAELESASKMNNLVEMSADINVYGKDGQIDILRNIDGKNTAYEVKNYNYDVWGNGNTKEWSHDQDRFLAQSNKLQTMVNNGIKTANGNDVDDYILLFRGEPPQFAVDWFKQKNIPIGYYDPESSSDLIQIIIPKASWE